ncbi:transketolase [archaeon]|jgi:transketolase|nr:transketolase [archaeon]MBT4352345.1 transketolase [archaeon]MBT4646944.1 transketolase [archaeon]MBT6821690.1 transketolase [archaeon]MBT7392221.1 transketolase [archaeon]
MTNNIIKKASDNMRVLAVSMVEKAKSGHPGGPMGGMDFINVLYSEFLKFNPEDMGWNNRDRFFLDAGHLSSMMYAQLSMFGKYSMEDLQNFRQWESPTPGHPELDVNRGIENSSGPLGQGSAMALGAAITERFLSSRFGEWMAHKTYCYITDGGMQEEISQGVARIAGHLGLSNLIMFYDSNDIQLSHKVDETMTEDVAKKFEAFGWNVITTDGHDIEKLRESLKEANLQKEKPTLIIGKTIMGKGAVDENGNSFEGKTETHGMPLSKGGASYEKTVVNLGGDAENPFVIFDDVKEYYEEVIKIKIEEVNVKKEKQDAWELENKELAQKLEMFYHARPNIDFEKIEQGENIATRSASKNVLSYFGENIENMIVMSADLSNSDKTDGFLKKTKAFEKNDFSGSFLQVGVSELTMAGIMNGMALHGGVIPACGTFFAFSDFMKPQIRLACLMGLQTIYIWTHDAFRVGEDGPTHQPIEQEAQIRLMEKMANLNGNRSMLVLRPADANETTVAWKMAIENANTPTALILSRQNINDLPSETESRFNDALNAQKGAYKVKSIAGKPDVVLVANGSEVSTLIDVAKIIFEKGYTAQVVSAISEGLFREQSIEYQEEVIPKEVPVFGLTAGLPVTLQGLVGSNGFVKGMERFGASAPYKILDEKFGFTPEQVSIEVLDFLKNK